MEKIVSGGIGGFSAAPVAAAPRSRHARPGHRRCTLSSTEKEGDKRSRVAFSRVCSPLPSSAAVNGRPCILRSASATSIEAFVTSVRFVSFDAPVFAAERRRRSPKPLIAMSTRLDRQFACRRQINHRDECRRVNADSGEASCEALDVRFPGEGLRSLVSRFSCGRRFRIARRNACPSAPRRTNENAHPE